jgi:hypothetical protein
MLVGALAAPVTDVVLGKQGERELLIVLSLY